MKKRSKMFFNVYQEKRGCKVTIIEEVKDLATLSYDDLIEKSFPHE